MLPNQPLPLKGEYTPKPLSGCVSLQLPKQPLACLVVILTSALSAMSLAGDTGMGRRKVVHVLGKPPALIVSSRRKMQQQH